MASEAKGRGFESRRARQLIFQQTFRANVLTRNLTAALALLASFPAGAADSGWYVGVGSGQAEIHEESANPNGPGTVAFTARNPLYRGFAGYRASAPRSPLPFLDVAAEAGYIDYGRSTQTVQGQNAQVHLHGLFVAGYLLFPIGPLDLFAKGGFLSWSSYKNIGGSTTDRSGSSALYGGGVGLRIGKIGIRSEYERADVSDLKRVETYSMSVVIQF